MLTDAELSTYRVAAERLDLGPSPPAIVLNLLDHIDALTAERDALAGRVAALEAALSALLPFAPWPANIPTTSEMGRQYQRARKQASDAMTARPTPPAETTGGERC